MRNLTRIEDGGGKNGFSTVSSNQRLDVSARAARREYYESRDNGNVYTAISIDATALAGEEIIYLQNISTINDMIVERLTISVDTNSTWTVKFVTGTAAGTSITPVNLNKASSNSALANILGNGAVTGTTDDGVIFQKRFVANDHDELQFSQALRLGQDDAIAVECGANAAVEIVVLFHFDSS